MLDVRKEAALRGLTTLQLFEEAYAKERGFIYGLKPVAALHASWETGWCCTPIYVQRYLERPHVQEPTQLLLL